MKKDALGNPIVLGNKYGYSVSTSGITTSVIGTAKKETKTGITLEVIEARRGLWDNEPKIVEYDNKKVSVKAMKLFPINL